MVRDLGEKTGYETTIVRKMLMTGGYKIYTSPFFPEPGPNKAVLAFGDFSYYNIGDRGPRSFAELKELFAGNGMVGFVAKERVDGKLVLPEAIKLLKTGAAKSSK